MTSAADRYDAVVFDNDGVLTHPSEHGVLVSGTEAAFDSFGVDPTAAEVNAFQGDVSPLTVCRIAARHGLAPERLWGRHERERAAAQLRAVRAGEKSLYDDIGAVEALDTATAIVSNNQQATVDGIVDAFDLSAFDRYTGRKPTIAGYCRRKPNPSYLEATIRDLGASSVLYVGDSRVDVAAANAAGVDSAYVDRPHRGADYLDVEPTYRLDGLDALSALPARDGTLDKNGTARSGTGRSDSSASDRGTSRATLLAVTPSSAGINRRCAAASLATLVRTK